MTVAELEQTMQPVRQRWTRTAALVGTLVVAVLWIMFCTAWLLLVRLETPAAPDILDELPFTVVPAEAAMTGPASAIV